MIKNPFFEKMMEDLMAEACARLDVQQIPYRSPYDSEERDNDEDEGELNRDAAFRRCLTALISHAHAIHKHAGTRRAM
jgi:hypothetical protein